jgi:hypothetical protein
MRAAFCGLCFAAPFSAERGGAKLTRRAGAERGSWIWGCVQNFEMPDGANRSGNYFDYRSKFVGAFQLNCNNANLD